MLKLAIFDLDNTLILEKYDEKGQRIVAEDAPDVLQLLKKLGFELYITSYNCNAVFDIDASKVIKTDWFVDIWGSKKMRKYDMINMIIQKNIDKFNRANNYIDAPKPKILVLFFDDLQKNIDEVKDHLDKIITILVDSQTGVKLDDLLRL